jgi:hypothetical protein
MLFSQWLAEIKVMKNAPKYCVARTLNFRESPCRSLNKIIVVPAYFTSRMVSIIEVDKRKTCHPAL